MSEHRSPDKVSLELTPDELTVLQVGWAKIATSLAPSSLPASIVDRISDKIDREQLAQRDRDLVIPPWPKPEAALRWQEPLAGALGIPVHHGAAEARDFERIGRAVMAETRDDIAKQLREEIHDPAWYGIPPEKILELKAQLERLEGRAPTVSEATETPSLRERIMHLFSDHRDTQEAQPGQEQAPRQKLSM